MGSEIFRDADMDDVLEDPTKFGAPSFDDFKKNREKWLGRDDEALGLADKGSGWAFVKKHIYEIEGYRCKTLEEVEHVALCQGIPLRELDYRPQMLPRGCGKWDILVKFVPRKSRDAV
jgi:hypothetical protein